MNCAQFDVNSEPNTLRTACQCKSGFLSYNGKCLNCTAINSSKKLSNDGLSCVCQDGLVNFQDKWCLSCAQIDINSEWNPTIGSCVCQTSFNLENGKCQSDCAIPGW